MFNWSWENIFQHSKHYFSEQLLRRGYYVYDTNVESIFFWMNVLARVTSADDIIDNSLNQMRFLQLVIVYDEKKEFNVKVKI